MIKIGSGAVMDHNIKLWPEPKEGESITMTTEPVKKTRKPRRNYAAEREKLIQTCRSRIEVFDLCLKDAGMPSGLGDNLKGQKIAFTEVLRILGEKE